MTPNAFLSFLGHDTVFSTSEDFNKEKVHQDWASYHCQYLGLTIPHLAEFKHHECPWKRFAIDDFGDHLHTCTQHAGATSGAHEHILTALQRLFTKAGYRTDRKHVPHSRGLKKADLLIKDFQLQGVRDVIVDVTCRHEFRGSCANQERNGEPSQLDVNGALDAAVKEKLDHYQHDYNERNFFFLPAVTTTSGRISGDFLRLLYILSHRQAANYFTRMGIIDPSPQAFTPTSKALVAPLHPRLRASGSAVVAVSEIHQCVVRIEMVSTYQMGIYHSRNGKTLVRTKWGSAHSRTRETGYRCTRLRHCAAPTSSGCLLWNTRSVSSGGEACIREGQASPQSCQR